MIDWLVDQEAVAYLIIERKGHHNQAELPSPVGRKPMLRLTHTAATRTECEILTYLVEPKKHLEACRLHLAISSPRQASPPSNLLTRTRVANFDASENLWFAFAS